VKRIVRKRQSKIQKDSAADDTDKGPHGYNEAVRSARRQNKHDKPRSDQKYPQRENHIVKAHTVSFHGIL